MMKNVVFGDAPHEDSNLLFTFVENPERGEVSLAPIANGDLTNIADEAVMTIGRRHTTPVTDHVKLQQKDLRLILEMARDLNIPVPSSSFVHQMYASLEADGRGDEGTQALVRVYEKLAGVEARAK